MAMNVFVQGHLRMSPEGEVGEQSVRYVRASQTFEDPQRTWYTW